MVYLFAALLVGIILVEVPPLVKEKNYREIIIFSCFLLAAFYLGMVQLYDWPFYSILSELALKMQNK